MLFYKLVLGFQGQTKTQEAYGISKKMSKSLDPITQSNGALQKYATPLKVQIRRNLYFSLILFALWLFLFSRKGLTCNEVTDLRNNPNATVEWIHVDVF
jgi:hypothetical protein